MSILSGLFANYGDDLARQFVDHADDAVLAGIRNYSDDAVRAVANQTDDLAKLAMPKRANVPLNQRLSGDSLLDAQDLIDTVKGVGGTVDDFGNVRLYHRTNPESAQKIMDSGKMFGKEDGLFFSTAKNGVNNSAYGNTPISFDIPAENLLLDDIFGDEASIRMPLQRAGQFADVSGFVNNPQKTALQSLVSDDGITPIYRGQKYGVNDLLYNKNGGGAAGAGKTPSISNAYYFTPNSKKTVNWAGENGGTIKIPMRNDDVITLQQLQDMIAEADPIFADPRKSLDLYNTNPTKYDLMEAVADRQYRTISELTKKPFIQPDSGQGEELMETLFFPDTNPTLTDIYRELLHRSGRKTN